MDIDKLIVEYPVMQNMIDGEEIFWLNERAGEKAELPFSIEEMRDAEARLARFAPYIQAAFPETAKTGGIIESPLTEINKMKAFLRNDWGVLFPADFFSNATAIWLFPARSRQEAASTKC